jgi:transposase InsO family protein
MRASLVQQHAASFIAHAEASTGSELPRFIKDEFDAFLECGILANGFLRLRCGECGHDKLLAFSCKRRGFCPSCGARRMSQTAAHLVDHVFPQVPVRQWVLSLPIPLRVLLAAFIDWYNTERPHSSLDDQTPDRAYWALLPDMKAAA